MAESDDHVHVHDHDRETLATISRRTIEHYTSRAEAFWEGTRDHDVRSNRAALLRHLPAKDTPQRILDLGCGPGRDLAVFAEMGHRAVGLDGCARFCEMARAHSGCEVLHQDMFSLELPASAFDGIFANASLFHVPTARLPLVLGRLCDALAPGGVLFASNPRGDNREGWQGERYGAYHDLPRWRSLLVACGFVELEHYYRPENQPREMQPWLATVFRKSPESA